ncbi:MAG TPA: SurA N-terminal domain-containing protein [Burkholderiaceae bacterium]|nr:SurA N-terminal domain-containing protein [Burkholderiaceae bacterium]
MFDFIRSHQRLMQFLLLVFIVPSFALIGVSGYSSYVSGDHDLVKIGRSAITQQEFDNALSEQLRQMQQNSPGTFDPDIMDDPGVREALLESLINHRLVALLASREHFNVSDAALRRSIAAIPDMQVQGQFSPERYNEVLASAGLTTRQFEQSQRAELAIGRVLNPVVETTSIPSTVVAYLGQALSEQRSVQRAVLDVSDFIDTVSASDDDIQRWYDSNKAQLEIPEQVSIDYILLDEDTVMASLPELTEQDLRDHYEQNLSSFTNPARANLSHIQINVAAGATQDERDAARDKAQELLDTLKDSPDAETFGEMAREHSEDAGTRSSGGELGWIRQGSWPASLDKAVFSLDKGELSSVIDGPGGYHIFYVNDIEDEQVESFESVRADVEEDIQHQLGAERFADVATRLTSLVYDHPESLDPVAQALSLDVLSADGVGRDRLLADYESDGDKPAVDSDHADILDDPRVRRTVYSSQVLSQGHNSGVIEISPDTMLAVNVREHHDARIPPLEQVTDFIRETLIQEKAHRLAVERGQDMLAQLQAGTESDTLQADASEDETSESDETIEVTRDDTDADDAAARIPKFEDAIVASRLNPSGIQADALDAALRLTPDDLPAYTGVESGSGFILMHVDAVDQDEPDTGVLDSIAADIGRMWGEAEQQAVLRAMASQEEVKRLPEADKAINSRDND